jgi:hypothetical protein
VDETSWQQLVDGFNLDAQKAIFEGQMSPLLTNTVVPVETYNTLKVILIP